MRLPALVIRKAKIPVTKEGGARSLMENVPSIALQYFYANLGMLWRTQLWR